jgi:hypothetical protein
LFEWRKDVQNRLGYRIARAAGAVALTVVLSAAGSLAASEQAKADGEPVPDKIELDTCVERPEVNFGSKVVIDINPSDQAQLQTFNEDYEEAVTFVSRTEDLEPEVRSWTAEDILCVAGTQVIQNPLTEVEYGTNFQQPGAERIAVINPIPDQGSWFSQLEDQNPPTPYSAAA